MEKYRYSDEQIALIEGSFVPFAVYQFINKHVVTIALSAGFCELFGLKDRDEAYELMDNDMYRDVHPDDVASISDAAYRFAVEDAQYDVIYRSKVDGEYRIIHAYGKHVFKEDGVRLAFIWYTDQGAYTPNMGSNVQGITAMLSRTLDERSRFGNISYDYLTGLPTMTHFFELAGEGCEELRRDGIKPAILFTDFNGMKNYNRKYGMAEGDVLLVAFAKLLSSYFGSSRCSRFSADHFCVYTNPDGLNEKLHELIEKSKLLNGGKSMPIRIGVYSCDSDDISISAACDRAKIACDFHKKNYESDIYYFDDAMMHQIEHRQYVAENLDRAIEEDWIKVYYQPIIRTANGRVCNEEALVRWEDPERGILTPDSFIPYLEEANSIYKLDLCVVDKVLKKMKEQGENGLYVVPNSVNLSLSDFYTCDIVEEIKKRVDDSGLSRDKLVIEITETVLLDDVDYMADRIGEFKRLGFSVWMDDYGSGYSSPVILQKIPFDLLKLDMLFIQQIGERESVKIILTELVRMAMALGVETIAEGVETEVQAEFLKEIGCTKLQGYYYCEAHSLAGIIERNKKGIQIGFENPSETDYYIQLGKVNLYDLSISRRDDDSLSDYFDTWPMCLVEYLDGKLILARCNGTFREFMERNFPDSVYRTEVLVSDFEGQPGAYSLNAAVQCAKDGRRLIIDDRTRDGKTLQLFIRRVAVNPVTRAAAVNVAILSVSDSPDDDTTLTYNYVARALSEDYIHLYFVNMDNGDYTEYSPDGVNRDMNVSTRGHDFFGLTASVAKNNVYQEDAEEFVKSFTPEKVEKSLKENGIFTLTYRVMMDGEPVYVSMKVVKVRNKGNNIIIGINNVDAQMKHEEALEKMREEQLTYSRIIALSGDYMALYTVNPETDEYTKYTSSNYFEHIGTGKEGEHFYDDTAETALSVIYPDDLDYFLKMFKKEKVMSQIKNKGMYTLNYRLVINGKPIYAMLKATMVHEDGVDSVIIGVVNIDEEVRREQAYESTILEAKEKANYDELTGVKNKHAYAEMEAKLNKKIKSGKNPEFAIAVFDINGLKQINDTLGHQAGDQFIKDGCDSICQIFKHSPVFRLGGDEFAIIVQGTDYDNVEILMESVAQSNRINKFERKVVIAAGMSRFEYDENVAAVFARADKNMYENKSTLKGERNGFNS
ncbi:sensor domain-containing diguanylate cyclase [Butyrivibrio sp. WCD3002]|uniref:sensor domain-containing diguanylate cyclase n=1 Tax=Butyrivibrio sp. WCD3002 TaxID=1280676 RepID=UPI000403EB14|nr:EAL domain-containing protein [Butyrivibrio sp. WCD3002]